MKGNVNANLLAPLLITDSVISLHTFMSMCILSSLQTIWLYKHTTTASLHASLPNKWSNLPHNGHDNLRILGKSLPIPILNGHLIKQRSHQTYDQTHVLLLSMVPMWLATVIRQHRLEKCSTVASWTVLQQWKRFIIGWSHAWRCRPNTVEVLDRGNCCIAPKWYSKRNG